MMTVGSVIGIEARDAEKCPEKKTQKMFLRM